MAREVIAAKVIGRSQNRTALGLMHAYLKMYPNSTLSELQNKFPKQKVCPDAAGITFYSLDELNNKQGRTAEWYFTQNNELLVLSNGQKVAFTKVWSASSLQLLQSEMAKHQIYGEVDKSCSTASGFRVNCKYQTQEISHEPQKSGIPAWVWIIVVLIVIVLAYFIYQ